MPAPRVHRDALRAQPGRRSVPREPHVVPKQSWLASGSEQRVGALGSVRSSSSHSAPGRQGGPEPSLPVPAVPVTSPSLLSHHKCKTPRLVKKIRVKLKPSWYMGVFRLAIAWLSPRVRCSTAVMSLVPHLSATKNLH